MFLNVSEMSQNISKRCLRIVLSLRNPLPGPQRPLGDGSDPHYKPSWKMRTQEPAGKVTNSTTRKVAAAARLCCLSHTNPLHTTAVPRTSWLLPAAETPVPGGSIAQPSVALSQFRVFGRAKRPKAFFRCHLFWWMVLFWGHIGTQFWHRKG